MNRDDPFTLRIRRLALALVAGTSVGLIAQECLWLSIDAFAFDRSLNQALVNFHVDTLLLLALALGGFAGGCAGGLMAALIGPGRTIGIATGLLLCFSSGLLMAFSAGDFGGMTALAAMPLPGAIIGAGVAQRIRSEPAC